MKQYPIELLSPARDLDCGIAAINHGADAVYIGGPSFSARSAAGNSLKDIEKLVNHARIFAARVYIAINTLFSDGELEGAVRLAHQLYELGADALIIQDMGLLECELPPIPLHASTQTDNRTARKVKFLEQVGFQQVVLARELSLDRIREIRAATSVPLECFVHGALCVSYSGQCYISEVVSGRSANRGECAQFCRHRYTLHDAAGRVLEKDRYLLSLKDLDLSSHLGKLIEAGISSFKIEGRLKDISYVKNVTARYRQLLDSNISGNPGLSRASAGSCIFGFVPDTGKSFNRGKTDYFLNARRARPGSPDTPKSLGELIGRVEKSDKSVFTVKTAATLRNGDGLCYFDRTGTLVGLKANRVDGRKVFHRDAASPSDGTVVYRNYDTLFIRQLQNSEQCRFLRVDVHIEETPQGLLCRLEDEGGIQSRVELKIEKEVAMQTGMTAGVIERQMRKSGGTIFQVDTVNVQVSESLFVPAANINELRRLAFSEHLSERMRSYQRLENSLVVNEVLWLSSRATYLDNITNAMARAFYRRHGVTEFDLSEQGITGEKDVALMTTRYCIKAQLGLCPKMTDKTVALSEPLTLTDGTGVYELEIDCHRCEMIVRSR